MLKVEKHIKDCKCSNCETLGLLRLKVPDTQSKKLPHYRLRLSKKVYLAMYMTN